VTMVRCRVVRWSALIIGLSLPAGGRCVLHIPTVAWPELAEISKVASQIAGGAFLRGSPRAEKG